MRDVDGKTDNKQGVPVLSNDSVEHPNGGQPLDHQQDRLGSSLSIISEIAWWIFDDSSKLTTNGKNNGINL